MRSPQIPPGAGTHPPERPVPGGSNPYRPRPFALTGVGWYARSTEPGDTHYGTPESLCRLDRGERLTGVDLLSMVAECGVVFRPLLLDHGDYMYPGFPYDDAAVCRPCLKAANAR